MSEARMITFREAQDFVLDSLTPLTPETLALGEAHGCVVAEELTAREAVPGFTNSSMDGFALRAQDTSAGSTRLKVIGSIYAGEGSSSPLNAGEAMRIMTGAPVPDGADCVCMIEQVTVDPTGQEVTINRTMTEGENVRQPGEDIKVGQVLVSPGDELGAVRLAVLASQGFATISAIRRLRVGVLSTGNELVRSDRPLTGGEIRDVNGMLLMSLLEESGFTAVDLGIAIDDREEITRRLRDGVRDCDAVVSTGGVSMGDVDHVKLVIGELGAERAKTMQVAIKPAKPFAFTTVGERRTPIFGLPGNPVSTRVSFELFVRPALRRLSGHRRIDRLTLDAILDLPLPRDDDGKLHLVHVVARVHGDGFVHVERAIRHGSHLLNALVGANAIAMLPEGASLLPGDVVRVIILDADELVAESST